MLRDGESCKHPGCLSHISHPCEGCGRIGGRHVASNGAPTPQEPLTLAKLTAMMEAMPRFPKYLPHYRCNQSTFDLMRSYMVQGEPSILKTVVGGCTIVIDQEVPEGEFWPPEGWKP